MSEITRKPYDIVSVALHDCNYDTEQAVYELTLGKYDEDLVGLYIPYLFDLKFGRFIYSISI